MTYASVEELLADARSRLTRLSAAEAHQLAERAEAQIVDIRPGWQRARDGEVPGSVIIERNHLEWRLHPESGAALRLANFTTKWIVLCTEGYTSSLAAASLVSLGLDATDIDGGITAWRAAGFPVNPSATEVEQIVAAPEPGR